MEKIFFTIMITLILIAVELGLIVGFLFSKISDKLDEEQLINLMTYYNMQEELEIMQSI